MTATQYQGEGLPKLTDKQRAFAEAYIICLNGKQAAIQAGYSAKTAEVAGSRLLRHVHVKEYIQIKRKEVVQRVENKFEVTIDRVLQEMARIAFFDPRKLFTESGQLKNICDLDDDTAAAVASLEIQDLTVDTEEEGPVVVKQTLKKLKLNSKNDNLEMLGRYLQMFGKKDVSNAVPFSLHIHMETKPKEPPMVDVTPPPRGARGSGLPVIHMD